MAKDYYRILGLSGNAEDVVIRAVFKLLAHRYHPDKWLEEKEQANRLMSEINEAYQHLSDIVLKAKYGQAVSASLDLYQILGVQSHVDAQMIHAAYEALARKHKSSPNRLNGINQAYAVLSDASERKDYDFQQKSLADANNRVLYNYKHRNSTDVSNRRVIFKRQSPVVYSWRKPGLSLWKVYLAYNLTFYVFMTAIFILITIM